MLEQFIDRIIKLACCFKMITTATLEKKVSINIFDRKRCIISLFQVAYILHENVIPDTILLLFRSHA